MIEFTNGPVYVCYVGLLRVIRVLRFRSLFTERSPGLRTALEALQRSKRAAFNLNLFLFLIIFIYSLIGVVSFKSVKNIVPINEGISFHSVGAAMFVLIQISTSAGWDGLYGVLVDENNYNPFSVFLFIWSFLFICILIIVNLILTVILNYYTIANENEIESTKLRVNDLNDFNDKWKSLTAANDPLFINKTQLSILLNRLDESSALRSSILPTEENIQLLGIPIHNENQLYHGDVLIALNKARSKQSNASSKK